MTHAAACARGPYKTTAAASSALLIREQLAFNDETAVPKEDNQTLRRTS